MNDTLKKAMPWAYSLIALYLRYTLGLIFWLSGQSKVEGLTIKEGTFWLFENEYNLPIIPPDIAAVLATLGEHVFSVMVLLGLGARLGAFGILGMTAVIQIFVYPEEYMLHGTWMAMAIVLILFGAGKFSCDQIILRRTKTSFWEFIARIRLKSNANSQKIHTK